VVGEIEMGAEVKRKPDRDNRARDERERTHFLVGDGDQLPVAVPRGDAGDVGRGALLISCGRR
jgi:hypothetical protein